MEGLFIGICWDYTRQFCYFTIFHIYISLKSEIMNFNKVIIFNLYNKERIETTNFFPPRI